MKDTNLSRNQHLLNELDQALQTVGRFGSVEIYVQGGRVTQITARKIKKTKNRIVIRQSESESIKI